MIDPFWGGTNLMQRQKFLNKKTSTVKFPKKSEKISPSKRLSHHLKIPFQKKLRPQKGGGLDLKKKENGKTWVSATARNEVQPTKASCESSMGVSNDSVFFADPKCITFSGIKKHMVCVCVFFVKLIFLDDFEMCEKFKCLFYE